MSTTDDFTGRRKTAVETVFLRGTTSSVKKRPFFPKQLLPLVPLDLNKIKREIRLEAENEEYTDTNGSITKNGEDNDLLDLPCDIKTEKGIETSNASKENFQPITKVLSRKVNDSFDYDFSPLSLQTPSKKYTSLETPDANKNVEIDEFDKFVTPTVKSVLHKKINCRTSLNTPKSISTVKEEAIKPEINENSIICSIPRQEPQNNMFSKFNINNVEYLILNILGEGGSSVVYQCFCVEKKEIVAIKSVYLVNTIMAQGCINEVKLLKRLHNCDRIITLYDYQIIQEEKKLLMVLEKGGNDFSGVLKKLTSQKQNIPLYMLVFYWMEMLLAVKQIHSNGVIHSDLKPSNFLSGDKGLKLIDFGIACSVQSDMTSVFKCVQQGSSNYVSPEALYNDATSPSESNYKIHFKSDVWSLGCILYELVYKKTPFQHILNVQRKLYYIMDPNHTIEYPEAKWLPSKVIDTIKKCLQYNVSSRPSVDELIAESESF